ncbi:MAG TPA: DUF4242 domain-containing protein [Rubrivivax sp.]
MNRTLIALHALLLAAPLAWAQSAPQRFLIERDMPGASKTSAEEFRNGAAKSNAVLRDLGPDIQWVHSYVAGDKVYCVYQATSEALIREHAAKSGFPATKITPIAAVLDPTTAGRGR